MPDAPGNGDRSPDLPPDLPPEYAEAYRRGYERAYRQGLGTSESSPAPKAGAAPESARRPPVAPDAETARERAATRKPRPAEEGRPAPPPGSDKRGVSPTSAGTPDTGAAAAARPGRAPRSGESPSPGAVGRSAPPTRLPVPGTAASTSRTSDAAQGREPTQRLHLDEVLTPVSPDSAMAGSGERRPPWFVPALLGGLAVLLVLSAYGLGRLVSNQVADTNVAEPTPTGMVMSEDGTNPSGSDVRKGHRPRGETYRGPVRAAEIGGAAASCQAPSSVDSGGHRVGYQPANVYDGDQSTAWRCEGDGVGERLTVQLPDTLTVGEVGLVPGYAKTDPRSGVDRYAENNRVTRVRWVFGNGTSVVQRFNGSPDRRTLQTMRIPKTRTDRVVIEILDSVPGPRNTIAVSEVRLGEVATGDDEGDD